MYHRFSCYEFCEQRHLDAHRNLCRLALPGSWPSLAHDNTREIVEQGKQHSDMGFQASVLKNMAPQRLQKRGPTSQILVLFECLRHPAPNTTQKHQEGSRKKLNSTGICDSGRRFRRNLLPRGFKKRSPKSQILVLFEFSRHRAPNMTQ